MAKFDLTARNCQYLDRHLTFPLLEFLLGKEVSKIRIFALFSQSSGLIRAPKTAIYLHLCPIEYSSSKKIILLSPFSF
jgi:eIF3 subunit 6 N terminal domain